MINFFNEFEKKYYDRLISEGWVEENSILRHSNFKHYIELNSYPIIQVKEDGKKVKCFHGFSGVNITIRNK